jgi:hypothetical protein
MTRPTRLTVSIVGMIVVLALLAVITIKVVFTKERVLAMLEPQIQRMIKRPVNIADAGISLWGGIGVRLAGVTVGNREGFGPDPMASVDEIDVKARFWPLLFGRVEVDRVIIEAPSLLLEFNRAGEANYEGMTETAARPDTATAGTPPVSIGKLIVTEGHFSLRDQQTGRWLDLYGIKSEAGIGFTATHTTKFAATIAFDSLLLLLGERHLAVRAGHPSLYAAGSWEKPTSTLRLDSTVVEWWGAQLAAAGVIRFETSLKEISANAKLASVPVDKIIAEIQNVFPLPTLKEFAADMEGDVEARFVWPLPEGAAPEWQGRFELTSVRWKLPQSGTVFTIPRVEVRGNDRSVSWSAAAGQNTGGTFSTAGTIDQLFTPDKTFSGRVNATLPLEGVRGFLPESWRMTLGGSLDLDLSAFGVIDNWRDLRLNGRIASDRLLLASHDWDMDSASVGMECKLNGHDLELTRCDWIVGDSRGGAHGKIEGILPAVLNNFDVPDVPRGEVDLVCQYVNLDRLIGDEKTTASDTIYIPGQNSPVPLLAINGQLTADTVIYNGLTISAASAPFEYKDRVLTLSPIDGSVFGGTAGGTLEWNLNEWPSPTFVASVRADSIEINDFLSRYLGWAGGLLGSTSFDGRFAGRGRVAAQIVPTLVADGHLDMPSGQLQSTPLLAAIGDKLGVAGLDQPRTLRDFHLPFRIDAGRVFTDDLRLPADNATVTARGSFGLDGSLAYTIAVRANSDRGVLGLQGDGVRVSLTGTPLAPTISVDAAGTASGILDNVVKQSRDSLKQSLDNALKDLLNRRKP